MFTLWTAPGQLAREAAQYLLKGTLLGSYPTITSTIYPAHSRKFRRNPLIIREVLALDRPAVLVTYNRQGQVAPVFAFILSEHVPMGQNAFQALPQIIGAAQAGFPVVWVQPTSATVTRKDGKSSIETMPALVWHVLCQISCIHRVPTVLVPMDDNAKWAKTTSDLLDRLIDLAVKGGGAEKLVFEPSMSRLLAGMRTLAPAAPMPLSRNSGILLSAGDLATYLINSGLERKIAEHLEQKFGNYAGHLVFLTHSQRIRSDPYAGTAAAYDYAFCRTGYSTRDRTRTLVLHFTEVSFEQGWKHFFATPPNKDTRLFLSLADALVFSDGLFYRCEQGWLPATQSFPERYLVPPPEDYDLGE